MNFPQPLAGDRRPILLLLSAALALVLGFVTFTADQSMRAIIYGGYWAMLVISVLFGWSMWKILRADWRGWAAVLSAPRWPSVLVGACGLLLLVHENYGFKILMDEVMLLGTSMSMHFDKLALFPTRGHDIIGAFELLGGNLDKRPLFQPFLVSLLHDFTGYRPENVFILNTALTFALLFLAYRVGCRISGRGAGAVLVLLLTSLPLLAQNATGGGFEVLNLVMILAVLLLGMRYAEKRDGDSLDAFFLASVLLAETRYESVLFLVPVGLLIGWVWWCDRRISLTWIVTMGPLFLVPYALHNRVFSVHSSAWELASKPGFDRPFALSYIPDNLVHGLNFFFSTSGDASNSLILSVLGFVAVPFFALLVLKTLRHLSLVPPVRGALAILSLGFAAHTFLLMCYFWGKFDDPVIRRLSLPLNVFLGIAVVTVTAELRAKTRVWCGLAGLIGISMFAFSIPAMARHDYTLEYYAGREMEWRREFIAAHPEKDYLFIDNDSIIWITHLISATPVKQALDHKGNIIFNFHNHIFSAIYVFQRYSVDPATGLLSLPKDDDLGPDYTLEKVWERRFTPLSVSRISRVVAIAAGPTAAPKVAPAATKHSPEELEKIRGQYLDNFIKHLP